MKSAKMYRFPRHMTPLMPPETDELSDLSARVIAGSAELAGRLHPVTRRTVAALLNVTNSYYSNLIEGHRTHPIDIERAMKDDYSSDPVKRRLQMMSRAHVDVQQAIPERLGNSLEEAAVSPEFIRWIHRRFYEKLPNDMHAVNGDNPDDPAAVIAAGEFRRRDVRVGNHVPPAYDALPDFMAAFQEAYRLAALHGQRKILAAAASHHRLAWIHPFLDGNGRVARLFTDAYFTLADLRGYGLWTVSRGLARRRNDYMAALSWGDAPRQGDLDGRGNLSEKGLVRFCTFFLGTCIDQIDFMAGLLDLDGLIDRIRGYVHLRFRKMVPGTQPLKFEATYLLEEALLRGTVPRGEASRVTGLPERTARDIVRTLLQDGLLTSSTPKGPLRLAIPTSVSAYWFPNLFPQDVMPSDVEAGL